MTVGAKINPASNNMLVFMCICCPCFHELVFTKERTTFLFLIKLEIEKCNLPIPNKHYPSVVSDEKKLHMLLARQNLMPGRFIKT